MVKEKSGWKMQGVLEIMGWMEYNKDDYFTKEVLP